MKFKEKLFLKNKVQQSVILNGVFKINLKF